MRHQLLVTGALLALSSAAVAQDKVTLTNGDVVTGTIKAMADGKVTILSPLLGEVVVALDKISDMSTGAQVELQTKTGDLLKRRIVGIEAGTMRLEGDSTALALDNLGMINPPPDPKPKWEGSLKINGLYTDGNTDRRAVGAAFDASMRRPDDRISFDAAWDYSEEKDGDPTSVTFRDWTLSQRRAGGGLKYDYFLSKRWYALVTARVLGDTQADLDLRFTAGAGLGYTWIEDEMTTFVTEGGLSYVNENYRSGAPSVDYLAARFAYRLSHGFTATTKLVHGVEAFPSTEDADDLYLQGKTEIVTSLTDSMLASLAHVIDYDNTPAPGRERVDNRVVLSIGWSF
jgi:putative salt-induced outer membrane protein YdiY